MSLPWAITQAQGIQRIAENGRTVVIVAQNAYATLSVSHFGHLLEDGWVALSGPPEELLSNDYVAISDPATVIRPGPGLLRAAAQFIADDKFNHQIEQLAVLLPKRWDFPLRPP